MNRGLSTLLCLGLCSSGPASAQTQAYLAVLPDVAIEVTGHVIGGNRFALVDPTGTLVLTNDAFETGGESAVRIIAAAGRNSGESLEQWLVLDQPFLAADGAAARAGKPFRCIGSPGCATLELLPLPAFADGAMVQALAFLDDGRVLLALDNAVDFGGSAFRSGTALLCEPDACVSAGFQNDLDGKYRVKALEVLDSGEWLVGFNVGGEVEGLVFFDDDVLKFNPTSETWALHLSMRSADVAWEPSRIEALMTLSSVASTIFSDGFE